jgi:NAD(P)H-nitrite reductase large subunit
VDEKKQPINEKAEFVECDTVLFSVGLVPENELTRKAGIAMNPITNGPAVNQHMQTSAKNVFACGNVVHVNDLVDNVSEESARAGKYAARYAMGKLADDQKTVTCVTGRNVRYLCPQTVDAAEEGGNVSLYFRVLQPELGVKLIARCGDKIIAQKKEFRVNPGEMCHVKFDTAALEGDTVTVEVVKED